MILFESLMYSSLENKCIAAAWLWSFIVVQQDPAETVSSFEHPIQSRIYPVDSRQTVLALCLLDVLSHACSNGPVRDTYNTAMASRSRCNSRDLRFDS